jgi:hypothetical protein
MYHLNKTLAVEDFGYRLIHISEYAWQNKRDIVISRIDSLLGITHKIPARKCVLKEINWPREFLEKNHIQGAGSPTSYNLGLFFQDNLVAVMTFSKPRFSDKADYELVRYCSSLGTTVIGGASKLFKKAPRGTIISYADRQWSQGGIYKTLGFTHTHDTVPGYYYLKNGEYLSRYQCQKHKLETKFPEHFSQTKTESEIMKLAGYHKVYDCGSKVYIK